MRRRVVVPAWARAWPDVSRVDRREAQLADSRRVGGEGEVAAQGIGAAGINIWFLERVGLARRDAVAATLRNGLAGGVVHVIALAIVVVKLPELITTGAGPAAALAAVLLHRLLTFWLPAVPGAVALHGLQRTLPRPTAIT